MSTLLYLAQPPSLPLIQTTNGVNHKVDRVGIFKQSMGDRNRVGLRKNFKISAQSAKLLLLSSELGLPAPSPASVNCCDIFMHYYATKIFTELYLRYEHNILECTYGESILQDFSPPISHYSTKCCLDAGKRLCSSRDTVSLKWQKDTCRVCRQDRLKKWIDWYQLKNKITYFPFHMVLQYHAR